MKLGKRLKHIESMVTPGYDHIWDCCCDHGLLGAALLARKVATRIHFVDIVPELMRELENKLHRFYPKNLLQEYGSQWQVHCMNVSALPLHEFSGKHLVIIAGIGGDLMTELVEAIYQKHAGVDIDFLLCPVHHQFVLRRQLIRFDFSLITERLMSENQRFYEILLVSTTDHPCSARAHLSPVGELIWQSDSLEQLKITKGYLQKTLDHYKRVQLNKSAEVESIIHAYEAVSRRLR